MKGIMDTPPFLSRKSNLISSVQFLMWQKSSKLMHSEMKTDVYFDMFFSSNFKFFVY